MMGEVLYVLQSPILFLSIISCSWLCIPLLYISWELVMLGVDIQICLVLYAPWSLLTMTSPHLGLWTQFLCLYFLLTRTCFVWRNQCTFQCYFFLLPLLNSVGFPMIPSPLGVLVSRGDPLSVTMRYFCLFLPSFNVVLFFHYREFLAHDIHLCSWLGSLTCQGCQLFFVTDCRVIFSVWYMSWYLVALLFGSQGKKNKFQKLKGKWYIKGWQANAKKECNQISGHIPNWKTTRQSVTKKNWQPRHVRDPNQEQRWMSCERNSREWKNKTT